MGPSVSRLDNRQRWGLIRPRPGDGNPGGSLDKTIKSIVVILEWCTNAASQGKRRVGKPAVCACSRPGRDITYNCGADTPDPRGLPSLRAHGLGDPALCSPSFVVLPNPAVTMLARRSCPFVVPNV